MKNVKRVLSLLLCLMMVITAVPMGAVVDSVKAFAAETEIVSTIIAMSDYQNSSANKKTVPQTIVNEMVEANVTPELALLGGDYTDGSVYDDGDDKSQASLKTELGNLKGILTTAWTGLDCYAIQGNHDYSGFLADGTFKATGAYEMDNYIVYLLNEDSFPWWQGGNGSYSDTDECKETVTATANTLKAYLDTLDGSKPVIIMSHVPMHWSPRSTTGTNWWSDNIYADILFKVVNEASEKLDILFLFGHNHSSYSTDGYDSEIGGALAYVAKGESMKIPNSTKGTANYTTETLNFTYMNAGYVGNYNGYPTNCSISAITIDSDSIDIDRYTYSGNVIEKSIELENVEKVVLTDVATGITVTLPSENTLTVKSDINVETLNNTSKYEKYKAYDITLSEALSGTATVTIPVDGFTSEAKVYYVNGSELTDMKATIENGVATFKTTHFSTYAVVEPTQGTWVTLPSGEKTYIYTQVDSITAGNDYVIVSNDGTVALMDNSGSMGAQSVTANGTTLTSTTELTQWTFSGTSSGTVYNGTRYLRFSSNTFRIGDRSATCYFNDNGSNFNIGTSNNTSRYNLYYDGYQWTTSGRYSTQYVRLYQYKDTDEPTGGYARLSGYLTQNYDLGSYEIVSESDVLSKVNVQVSTDKSNISETISLTSDMVKWDKTFNGTTAGTYTATVTYKGQNLGTITVNVTGELVIDDSWIELETTTSTGEYQQVTNISDINSTDKYIVVVWRYFGNNPNEEGYVFHDENNGNIKVSTSDGYATITSTSGTIDDGCYWYITNNGNGTVTMKNVGNNKYLGSNIVANSNSAVNLDIASGTYSGYQNFAIGYNDAAIRYSNSSGRFSYAGGSPDSAITDQNACDITIYKKVEASTIKYVRLTGETEQTYQTSEKTSLSTVLGKVKIHTSADGITIDTKTIDVTSDMVKWDKTFDGTTAGTYKGTVTYNGKVLGTITVTITQSPVAKIELITAEGTVSQGSGNSAKTGGKIKVTYEDGTTANVNVTLGMLNNDASLVGTFENLTVTYGGKTVTGFTLTVEVGENDFPEYPNEGAVDLNKVIADSSHFQDTGVAEIQLSTSGIPMHQGIDVVLVLDTSSSMQETVSGFSSNRLTILRPAVNNLIVDLQAKGEDGSNPDLDIAIVAFNGFTGSGNSETRYGSDDYIGDTAYATPNAGGWLTDESGDGWVDIMSLSNNWADEDQGNIDLGSGTNYDEGLLMAYELLEAKQNTWAEDEVRQQYVIFMSDGAPFQYNGVYSNYTVDEWENWLLGNYKAESDIPSTVTHKNYYAGYAAGQGQDHRIAEAIKGDPDEVYDIITTTADTNGTTEVKPVKGLGATIYTIGYLLADNGQVTDETQNIVLKNMASSEDVYFDVDTEEQLESAFKQISTSVKMAAKNAYFVDQMGDSFDLQMASTITKFAGTDDQTTITLTPVPQITVSTYDIYTNADNVDDSLIGKRKGTKTDIEIVTFNPTGTEAYSLVDTDGDGLLTDETKSANIISDGVIVAKYFFYNTTNVEKTITLADGTTKTLPAETFYWNIGTISNTEFVLSYYVYLEGSAEGKAEAGTYATNNYATLYYTNWLDHDVNQSVQSPTLAWESASVYYGFYLVDKNGNPVVNQTTGETGSFDKAIKVTQKIFYDEVKLNDVESVGTTIEVVSSLVPEGYSVYDNAAKYTITIDSSAKISGWKIVNSKSPDTTYVTDYRGTDSTNVTDSKNLASQTGVDYTSTTVWFAVVWIPSTVPDAVVIDFGLPVDISVLLNDQFGDYGTLNGVGTLAAKETALSNAGTDASNEKLIYTTTASADFGAELISTYGKAIVNGSEVRYTPANMQMNSYDKFAYEVEYKVGGNEATKQYYYGDVTVIPATTVYYEDSFVTFDGNWSTVGTVDTTSTQAEDRPGYYSLSTIDANNIYGYDKAYENMSEYSLGSARVATVNTGTFAKANFTFYGTGFDIISLTSNTTGTLAVKVTAAENIVDSTGAVLFTKGDKVKATVVDTYYGYARVKGENGYEWVLTNTTDNALYQVPVMQIEELTYGKYNVEITATYTEVLDNTTGTDGYELYLDAIRIYDPAGVVAGKDNDTIEKAYNEDKEAYPYYYELRNQILSTGDFDAVAANNQTSGMIFIDKAADEYTIEEYSNYGPNNELYLASVQSVAFVLNVPAAPAGYELGKIELGVKSVGGTAYVKYYDANTTNIADVKARELATATDMYYDITALNGKTVVISNSGTSSDAIVSITNIKVTYTPEKESNTSSETGSDNGPDGTDTASVFSISRSSADVALMSLRMVAEDVTPDVDDTTSTPEADDTTSSEPETDDTVSTPETDDNASSKPEDDTTSVPETSKPETEEDETEKPEKDEVTKEDVVDALKNIFKKVSNTLNKLLGKWFR